MNFQTIVMCVVALILGMLLAHMLKSVCGCKLVEGQAACDRQATLLPNIYFRGQGPCTIPSIRRQYDCDSGHPWLPRGGGRTLCCEKDEDGEFTGEQIQCPQH
tara:strand:+ start:326 stop:634 length:309 start_codon:yes stop_codon:yes gene_type:complete